MKNIFFFLSFFFLDRKGSAFPIAPHNALDSKVELPFYLDSYDYDFEGIVKLSNCSGAVIKFIGQDLNDRALVLTNGHCLESGFF